MSGMFAVGSYTAATGGRGAGISLVDAAAAEVVGTVAAESPSFVAWSPDGGVLYAAEETEVGAVSAYRVGRERGSWRLEQIGRLVLGCARPCHLAVHPSGGFLAASCYGGGAVVTVSIAADGGLGGVGTVIRHTGRGPHPTRQDRPHPHSVTFTLDGSLAVLADIGLDTLSLHEVVGADILPEARLVRHTAPGAGPRHAVWLDARTLAVVEEISATISVVRVEAGRLDPVVDGVATTASGDPDAWPSEITVLGGELVVANRRPGSLARFAWSGAELSLRTERALPPANARHVAADDDGMLWVALQDGDAVAAVDATGEVRRRVGLGSPSCVAHRP